MNKSRNSLRIFVALCLLCAIVLGVYFYRAAARRNASSAVTATTHPIRPVTATSPHQIFFRYTGVDENYGKLAVVDYPNLDAPRFIENLPCEVIHFAAGRGICLTADRGVFTTFAAQLFDSAFAPLAKFPLNGGPSRARVSPDGALAAFTVFLSGHGYASLDFSTQTLIVDTSEGHLLASLEDFTVLRDGQRIFAKDFNFWGVTFKPDSSGFYCTLSTNGTHLLLEGDVATRTAKVLHENVECPSVSPDGTRVAYKKRFIIGNRLIWQLHVLDLATMKETALAEKRSVDDQLEWLDNEEVLYSVSDNPEGSSATTNIWKADARGLNAPEMFLPKAYSPAVVR